MRVFSPPFCGRDGESLSIRARGGRRAPPPASCTRLHRAFTLVPGWPRSTGNPSSTGRRTRTPDGSAAWTPSRAPGSGTGARAASMGGSGAAWRIPGGSRAGASSCNRGHGPVRSAGAGVRWRSRGRWSIGPGTDRSSVPGSSFRPHPFRHPTHPSVRTHPATIPFPPAKPNQLRGIHNLHAHTSHPSHPL